MDRKRPSSTEGSSEAAADSTHRQRPRRRCLHRTNALMAEQVSEELEEQQQVQDQRLMRLKEKNKRAQQRFRERQKEKSQQTVQQAEKLQRQVDELQSRAAAAEERCMLMERLLAIKDSERSIGPPDQKLQRAALVLDPYKTGLTTLPDKEFVMVIRAMDPGRLVQVDKEKVLSMSFDEHVGLFREYIKILEAGLKEATGDPLSPAHQHIQGVVREMSGWCLWINNLVPQVLPSIQGVRLDTGLPTARPSSASILETLRANGLSEEQETQLVSARRFCLSTLASLWRECQNISATLKEVVRGESSWENMNKTLPTLVELQRRLSGVVAAEGHAFHTFMSFALVKVLTPLQFALLMTRSYPFTPSPMGIIALIAGETEGGVVDLLQIPQPPDDLLMPGLSGCLDDFSDEFWNSVLAI